MKYIISITIFCLVFSLCTKKYRNPYKLYMVFGKKGSGKSAYLVRQALKYKKKGYLIYSNMTDMCVEGVRLICPDELGEFVPAADSVLLLDEVGMLYDNRNYKNFKPAVRDFFKLQRHYKVICYLASQTFDIDKKLRDLTDEMFLVTNIFTIFSLVRPIRKTVTLTESTSEAESRIAENLRFRFITEWRIYNIVPMIKYFKSYKVPDMPPIQYSLAQPVETGKRNRVRNRLSMRARIRNHILKKEKR